MDWISYLLKFSVDQSEMLGLLIKGAKFRTGTPIPSDSINALCIGSFQKKSKLPTNSPCSI